jgi:1-acyl-sn-glycerol-3-phosphate acyltransferase
MTFADRLRSILFLLVFFGATVPVVLLALPVAAVSRRAFRSYALAWVRFHNWCVRRILRIRIRIEGELPQGPSLIVAKHQSLYEPLGLLEMLDAPGVVMKRQLGAIPLWGWLARRYGAIPIDRSGGADALRKMMRAADALKTEGRGVLIFPEGTRVAPGEQPPLQPGFAGLYRRLSLPVVPVALDSGGVWPRRGLLRRRGTITMRFLPAIPPGLPRADIERQVHQAINSLEQSR